MNPNRIIELERENSKLKNTVVESVELVSDYKKAVGEMTQFVNQLYKQHLGNMVRQQEMEMGRVEELTDELEDEEDIDLYEHLRKKTTVH